MNKSKGTITVRLSLNVEMRDLHYVYQRLASSPTEVERRHELKQILFEFQFSHGGAEPTCEFSCANPHYRSRTQTGDRDTWA